MLRSGDDVKKVRAQCAKCGKGCDPTGLQAALATLAVARSLRETFAHQSKPHLHYIPVRVSLAHTKVIPPARLEFSWRDPFAIDLNLVCEEAK
jgi:hypothetical protein